LEVGAVQVEVRGSIDKAMTILKRKCVREGIFAALRRHVAFVKPSERKRRKREANRRRRMKIEAREQRSEQRQRAAIARRR